MGSLQLCPPSRDKVSTINHMLYLIGACKDFLSPLAPNNMEFSLDSNLVVCKTSIPGICVLWSHGFMDVYFPSDDSILEAMIMDHRTPSELEYLHASYQRIPCLDPSNGIYLEH